VRDAIYDVEYDTQISKCRLTRAIALITYHHGNTSEEKDPNVIWTKEEQILKKHYGKWRKRMSKKRDKWDVSELIGQSVAITAAGMPVTTGTIVEQDKDAVYMVLPSGRPTIIAKEHISSLTQESAKEAS
jgi:sRNA-binding protein